MLRPDMEIVRDRRAAHAGGARDVATYGGNERRGRAEFVELRALREKSGFGGEEIRAGVGRIFGVKS